MKKLFIFLMTILALTSCTSLEEFNKKLEDFNKSLPGNSSTKVEKVKTYNFNPPTYGKGKFENAKIIIVNRNLTKDYTTEEVILEGFYTNISKEYQRAVDITVDLRDKDGDRVGEGFFQIKDIRPGERKNLSKEKNNMFPIPKGLHMDTSSWKIDY